MKIRSKSHVITRNHVYAWKSSDSPLQFRRLPRRASGGSDEVVPPFRGLAGSATTLPRAESAGRQSAGSAGWVAHLAGAPATAAEPVRSPAPSSSASQRRGGPRHAAHAAYIQFTGAVCCRANREPKARRKPVESHRSITSFPSRGRPRRRTSPRALWPGRGATFDGGFRSPGRGALAIVRIV